MYATKNKSLVSEPQVLQRRFLSFFNYALYGIFIVYIMTATASAQPAVCPGGSVPDQPWTADKFNIGHCIVGQREGEPALGKVAVYNLYCPARIPAAEPLTVAYDLGGQFIEGRRMRSGANPVLSDYADESIEPRLASVSHVFHYGCIFKQSAAGRSPRTCASL